jgi:hypothetical protein
VVFIYIFLIESQEALWKNKQTHSPTLIPEEEAKSMVCVEKMTQDSGVK